MYSIFKELILPPGSLWLLLAAGFALLFGRNRRSGVVLIGLGLLLFYALAAPVVSSRLSALGQTVPALSDDAARNTSAGAIVVLSGGLRDHSPEFGGATADEITVSRLRYAARLHRLTGLPVLVSGGQPPGSSESLAVIMKRSLADDFGISQTILEDKSRDTRENALFSAVILHASSVRRIILVTHAIHMPRALQAFQDVGLEVVPAPTVFAQAAVDHPVSYVPRISGLRESHYAIYEALGRLWYRLRH